MKIQRLFTILIIIVGTLTMESCGPVIISSRPDALPPVWFYPNRVEMVRYIYFPEYRIYYDIHLRNYTYYESDIWVTVNVLPPRFNHINLRRSRYVRIRNYRGDNIRSYHSTSRYNTRSRYDNRSRYDRNGTSRSRGTQNKYDRSRNTRNNNTSRSRDKSTRSRSTTTRSRNTRSRDSIN